MKTLRPRRLLPSHADFSTSRDLRSWTPPKLILAGEMTFTWACGDPEPMAYASLLDPASESHSFDTAGARPYLYFVHFRYAGCTPTERVDVVRIPLESTRTP